MSTIEHKVMASVGVIYAVRRLVSPPAIKLYVCIASVLALAPLVWVAKVFENMAQVGVEGFVQFAFAALLNTDIAVQGLLALGAAAFVWMMLDLLRATPAHPLAY